MVKVVQRNKENLTEHLYSAAHSLNVRAYLAEETGSLGMEEGHNVSSWH